MKRLSTWLAVLALGLAGVSAGEAQLNGTYTIGGTAPDYATFAAAITALGAGVSGPVVFNVRDGVYNENPTIGVIAGASPTHTVTFQAESGDSTAATLQSNGGGHVLFLDGTRHVVIRQLTLDQTGSSGYSLRLRGPDSLAVERSVLRSAVTHTAALRLDHGGATGGDSAVTISHNVIEGGNRGVYSANSQDVNLRIEGNRFSGQLLHGIDISAQLDGTVADNYVDASAQTHATGRGIDVATSLGGTQVVAGNQVFGAVQEAAMYLAGLGLVVHNNFISAGDGSAVAVDGLVLNNADNAQIYHNSAQVRSSDASSRALWVRSSTGNLDLRNNIFAHQGAGYAAYVENGATIAASDYNDLFSAGAKLGDWQGTKATTLAAWQAASGHDANSIFAQPVFVSAGDMHAGAPGLDGAGTPLASVTVDIDGAARNATHPDIGADEFTAVLSSVDDGGIAEVDPAIPFAPGVQSVVALLKNTGTTTLTSAAIDWSIDLVAQPTYNWSGSLAPEATAQVTLGSASFILGTYYQLDATLTQVNGAADAYLLNNSVTAAGLTPGLNGTYTIGGTAPDYATFAAAITALDGGVVGPVVFNVRDGVYNENPTIGVIAGASPTHTVTFQSASGDSTAATLQSNGGGHVLFLDGTRHVVIRQLTLDQTGSSGYSLRLRGPDSLAVERSVLRSAVTHTAALRLDHGGATGGDSAVTISHNVIEGGNRGVYSANSQDVNLRIEGNRFSGQLMHGIDISAQLDGTVADNYVDASAQTHATGRGIDVATSLGGTQVVAGNQVFGAVQEAAMYLAGLGLVVHNNFISAGDGSAVAVDGLVLNNADNAQVYHNSVQLRSSDASSRALWVRSSTGNLDLRNNIFAHQGAGYATYVENASSIATSDYNDLYSGGAQLGHWAGGNTADLVAWQAASGHDANSISVDPLFSSATDLHVAQPQINAAGTPLASVTVDIDGETRNATHPDIGADEFTPGVLITLGNTTAPHSQVLTVPVIAAQTTGAGLISAELFISYDGDVITAFSIGTSNTLLSLDWAVESNVVEGNGTNIDTIKIAMATDDDELAGDGPLVFLNFQVADPQAPATTSLTLEHTDFNDGSPVTSTDNGSVTVTGTDGTIDATPATVLPGAAITVTVTDADGDTDAGSAQTVNVSVANGAQTETMVLTETGNNTGVFTANINTEFSQSPVSGDGTVQVVTGDQIDFSYSDALDAAGNGPIARSDQVDVLGGADGSVQVTAATQPGDVLYIRVTDPDLNTDPGTVETAQVVVSSSNGESETVTLTEVDADDDAFFGGLASAAGASAGADDDGTINGQKGDVLTATYDDAVSALGGQVDRTDVDQVVDPFGDADGNAAVQAFDAAQTLLHVLVPHLTGLELVQANVDADPAGTGVTPFDASLILQKRVGIITVFPVQLAASTNHPQNTPASPKAAVEARQLALAFTDEGYLSLSAAERGGILSGDVLIDGIDGRVVLNEELGQFIVASRPSAGGLRIAFAGAAAISGPGELLRVYPGVGPDRASLTRVELNDGQLQADYSRQAVTPVPQAFALHANAPNPFNPATQIRFDLPRASPAQLAVYDMLGQKVRTLVASPLAAGRHSVGWDGRDQRGGQVASGVYFYRLRAGEFTQMRRMLLLK